MKKFYYPPKPGTLFFKSIPLNQYTVQWKWRGWRICIDQDGNCYTRTNRPIDITTNFPKQNYDYQLDGEIISLDTQVEHKVRKAIRENNYKIKIFDIFIPSKPELTLEERLQILKEDFNIEVECQSTNSFEGVNELLTEALDLGREGIVLKKQGSTWRAGNVASHIERDWIKVKELI